MEAQPSEQGEWRAIIITLVIVGVVLGIEQALPISDALRSQIGVLTILLAFGLWHVVIELVKAEKH